MPCYIHAEIMEKSIVLGDFSYTFSGRSSDFPALSAAFPIHLEAVAH